MPTPPTLVPRFPASAFAAAAGRWRAGAGAVTGAVFNPVRAAGNLEAQLDLVKRRRKGNTLRDA